MPHAVERSRVEPQIAAAIGGRARNGDAEAGPGSTDTVAAETSLDACGGEPRASTAGVLRFPLKVTEKLEATPAVKVEVAVVVLPFMTCALAALAAITRKSESVRINFMGDSVPFTPCGRLTLHAASGETARDKRLKC